MSNIYEEEQEFFAKWLAKDRDAFIKMCAALLTAEYLIELELKRGDTALVLLDECANGYDMMVSYGYYDYEKFPLEMASHFPKGRVKRIHDLNRVRERMVEAPSCPGLGGVETIEREKSYPFRDLYQGTDGEAAEKRGWVDAGEYRVYFSVVDATNNIVYIKKIVKFDDQWYKA